jgi:ADP-heptose:LPS heptosyltransferase
MHIFRIPTFAANKLSNFKEYAPYDVILDLRANLKSGVVASIIPAKYVIGYNMRHTKEFNFLFRLKCLSFLHAIHTTKVLKSIRLEKMTINTYTKPFELLYKVGFPYCKVEIPTPVVDKQKEQEIGRWLESKNIKKFILIHPGSSKKGITKRWDIENYSQLANDIKKIFNLPCVILHQGENEIVQFFNNTASIPEFEINLEEMIILISRCEVFIGNDSGPLHLASVLGKKCIGIYCASNPYIMGHPNSIFISNYFPIAEKYSKKHSFQPPYHEVWNKVKEVLQSLK